MEKVRTIFFGSGEFAVPILKKLLDFPYIELKAVVTQPDKPAGRRGELKKVPVAEFLANSSSQVRIYQPEKYRTQEEEILSTEDPELIIVADYGQLLPSKTIKYPKHKCLNVHGSILPDLRGAVPIPLAILKGYIKTGVSIPVMTEGLDNGPVVAMQEVEISDTDNTQTLKQKLAEEGANLLIEILPMWYSGQIKPELQDESKATYADKTEISKEKAQFRKKDNFMQVERMIRAFYPWPIAWTIVNIQGKILRLKVVRARLIDEKVEAGKFDKINDKLILGLEGGSIELFELQLEGKKPGKGEDYAYLAGQKAVLI